MSALSREQVESICAEIESIPDSEGVAASDFMKHDAALRATIEQQAQEIVRLKATAEGQEVRIQALRKYLSSAITEHHNAEAKLAAMTERAEAAEHFKADLLAKMTARGLSGRETDGDKELVSDMLFIALQRRDEQLAMAQARVTELEKMLADERGT